MCSWFKKVCSCCFRDNNDKSYFKYAKKTNIENKFTVASVQLKSAPYLEPLTTKMKHRNSYGDYLNAQLD